MSVSTLAGSFGFATQAAKVGSGTFTPANYTWRRFRAPRISFGPAEMANMFPDEIGDDPVPSGGYKAGMFVAGDVDVLPRLENIMGGLFLATMGSVSSVTGQDAWGNANAAVRTHIFRFDPTLATVLPWFAARRMVPGSTAAENFGETAYDCRMAALRLTIPAAALMAARFTFVGRQSAPMEENPSWTWANTYEDTSTVPLTSHEAVIRWGGISPKITAVTLDLANGLTTPAQEMIVGSRFPDDFTSLRRSAMIRCIVKWENADLYRQALTGDVAGTAWAATPFYTTTSGPDFAFQATFRAPTQIPSSSPSLDYGFHIRANRVWWRPDGPIELAGNNLLQQAYIGAVCRPTSGDYLQLIIENAAAGPVAGS